MKMWKRKKKNQEKIPLRIKDIYSFEDFKELMERLASANDWLDQIEAWGIYIEYGTGPIYEYVTVLSELFLKIFGEKATDEIFLVLARRDSGEIDYERGIKELYERN